MGSGFVCWDGWTAAVGSTEGAGLRVAGCKQRADEELRVLGLTPGRRSGGRRRLKLQIRGRRHHEVLLFLVLFICFSCVLFIHVGF